MESSGPFVLWFIHSTRAEHQRFVPDAELSPHRAGKRPLIRLVKSATIREDHDPPRPLDPPLCRALRAVVRRHHRRPGAAACLPDARQPWRRTRGGLVDRERAPRGDARRGDERRRFTWYVAPP